MESDAAEFTYLTRHDLHSDWAVGDTVTLDILSIAPPGSYGVAAIEYPRTCGACHRPWVDFNLARESCPFCGAPSQPDEMKVDLEHLIRPGTGGAAYMRAYRAGRRINPKDRRPRCASCGQLGPSPCERCEAEGIAELP